MKVFLNPIAELDDKDSGHFLSPRDAKAIASHHRFYCPDFDCSDAERILILKTSNRGTAFFSHRGGFGHDISPETLLHKSAIKWFYSRTEFELPACSEFEWTSSRKVVELDSVKTMGEFRKYNSIIPDIRMTTKSGFDFAVEIIVTNDISARKREKINELNLPCLKITLTDFYISNREKCRVDLLFINGNLDRLLNDYNRKSWVSSLKENWQNVVSPQNLQESPSSKSTVSLSSICTAIAIGGIAIWAFLKPIRKKNSRSRR